MKIRQREYKSVLLLLVKFTIACLVLLLSACITLPGHRVLIDESDFYLHIQAPSKRVKELTRFNPEKTELLYLPEKVSIELLITDAHGIRHLDIKRSEETIVYDYKLNGRKVKFGIEEQNWFATLIPRIINKTGLESDSH